MIKSSSSSKTNPKPMIIIIIITLFSNYFELVVSINHRSSLIVFMLVLYLGCFTELNLTQNISASVLYINHLLSKRSKKKTTKNQETLSFYIS